MPRVYGLLDLFALVEHLLAPFVDPLRAEFAVKAIDRPRPVPQPQPKPQPAPEPATPVVARPPVVDTLPAVGVGEVTTDAEPLYVRRHTGGQWRYQVAKPGEPGEKFRRLATAGRRARYEPAADPITPKENDRERDDRRPTTRPPCWRARHRRPCRGARRWWT